MHVWGTFHIPTCILVLKKSKKDNKTQFIDASSEFVREGNKNKLNEENRKKILEAFVSRKNIDYFSIVVDNKLISQNKYDIAVSTYLEREDIKETIDISILNSKIETIVKKQSELRTSIDNIISSIENKK